MFFIILYSISKGHYSVENHLEYFHNMHVFIFLRRISPNKNGLISSYIEIDILFLAQMTLIDVTP
jgi:hypothetical protein